MKQKTKSSLKKNAVNFFGAFGYLYCMLQWFWAVMLYFSVIQSTTNFISPDASTRHIEQASSVNLAVPDPLKWIVLGAVVILMVGITAYALVKMPMMIVKSSHKAVRTTAKTVAPAIIKLQHKPETEKAKRKVALWLMPVIKAALVITPLAFTICSGLLDKQYVDYTIATGVGYALAAMSLVSFALQYLLSKLLRVAASALW